MQGLNPGILHRVKDPGICVFLHFADAGNQIWIAARHSQSPAAHIKRLREGIQLHADIFGPRRHQETQVFLTRKYDLTVGVVITDSDIKLTRKGHQLVQKNHCGTGAGRVVRIIQEHRGGFSGYVRGDVFQHRQIMVLREDGNVVRNSFSHQDAGPIRRIAGVGHQHNVPGIDARQHKMMTALLGTDKSKNFIFGIQADTVPLPVPAGNFFAESKHPLFLIGGIAMILRVICTTAQCINDGLRSGFHRVSDRKRYYIHARSFGLIDFFPQFHK